MDRQDKWRVRGLSLPEDMIKALDGISTRRIQNGIAGHTLDTVLSASSVGYQRGRGPELVWMQSDRPRTIDLIPDFRQ